MASPGEPSLWQLYRRTFVPYGQTLRTQNATTSTQQGRRAAAMRAVAAITVATCCEYAVYGKKRRR